MPAARKRSAKKPSEQPQTNETWGALVAQLRTWIAPEEGAPYRPYGLLVLDLTHDKLMAMQLFPGPPTAEETEAVLADAITKPGRGAGKPRRPAEIVFADPALARALAPALAQVGIVGRVHDLPELRDAIRGLEAHMRGGQPENPGLLSVAGVTPALAGGVFAAAADYYRAAPWVALTNAQALAVRIPPDRESPRIVTTLGNAGVQYGLGVYERWSDFERVFLGGDERQAMIGPEGNLVLWFDSVTAVPFDDLDAAQAHGWEVADERAYPLPIVIHPEAGLTRPGPDELRWLEAALRAVARVARERLQPDGQGDYAPFDVTLSVPTHAGETPVRVTYPAGKLALERRSVVGAEWEADEADDAVVFDRRMMESAMAGLGAALGAVGGPSDPKLREAQQLMYRAWEERNPARRLTLAHEALALSPDCADAYVLLAEEEADTAARALDFYQQGVAAGERALGAGYFDENAGHFWGLLETRPYMRAREGLANMLWSLGRRAEAAAHYREMLRLNPSDNQGLRYSLLNLLLEMGDDAGAQTLLDQHDDGLAEWQYTRALLAFRRGGPQGEAARRLAGALQFNPHVPAYLTGRKLIPNRLPPTMGWGDETEAQHYAARYLNFWRRTPGAVEWLAGQAEQASRPRQRRGRRSGRA